MPAPVVMAFDGGCPVCRRSARLVSGLDWLGLVRCVPYDDAVLQHPELAEGGLDAGLRLRRGDGRVFVGAPAVCAVARRLPLVAPLGVLGALPVVRVVVARAYAAFAGRRGRDGCTTCAR